MRSWYSTKFNPAARYLPQVFSLAEQELVYRCLEGETRKTDNRGTSTGAIDYAANSKFLLPEQEAILKTLEALGDDLSLASCEAAIARQIENNRYLAKKKALCWITGKEHSPAAFQQWWKRAVRLPSAKRKGAVAKFRQENIRNRPYAMAAMSATVGAFSRDANNQWARISVKSEHLFSRALPIIRRIDAAFQAALPDRWALQKDFCETIDPRFVVDGTCFTTLTVNKNYRTAEHRDAGDLSQGFSNIAVFSNGRKFSGGHLVLPEFNVEICLRPGDLLFVANHEHIHQNTAITNDDPESERLSVVAYAREAFAFSGTLEYETLREQFQRKNKKFSGMWASAKWYSYLRKELEKGKTLIDQARASKCLHREVVLLSHLHESDPLWEAKSWEYVGAMPLTSQEDLTTLRALFSAAHFKVARQDRWLLANTKEEGAKFVDAVYIDDEWAFAYCETESGAVKFDNNRFNVQAVGKLNSFTLPIQKLTADAFAWLAIQWEQSLSGKPVTVCLVRSPTGIPEAPFRYALTTLTRAESTKNKVIVALRTDGRSRSKFYATGGTIGIRDRFPTPPNNDILLDLGLACRTKKGGVLTTDGEPICDLTHLRSETERSYLQESLAHWRKRALNLGSADYKTRFVRVGNYVPPSTALPLNEVGRPWHWKVTPTQAQMTLFGWTSNKRDIKRKVRAPSTKVILESRGAHTTEEWNSKFQAPLLLAATAPLTSTLAIWKFANSKHNNGQACLTNGKSLWMFQALSTIVPLRRGTEWDRDSRVTTKIDKPSVVGHLQRSEIEFKEDKSPLIRQLRDNPAFIPTPFSEMSPKLRKDYSSPYKKGRANVIAVGGPPASGKTTLMKRILDSADDWVRATPHKLIEGHFSKTRNTWIIGVYDQDGGIFQGTDKLSKAVGPALVSFVRKNANSPINILFEGNNVVVSKTLREIVECDVNFVLLRLMVAKSLKKARHSLRGDSQSQTFLKAKETAIANVSRDPLLFDHIVEVRNETPQEQQKLIEMIDWFTRRAKSSDPSATENSKNAVKPPLNTLEKIGIREVQSVVQSWESSEALRVVKQAHGLWMSFKNYPKQPPVVLRHKGAIAAIAFRTINKNGYLNLYDIATAPQFQGKGFASQLWKQLISEAHLQGATRIKMGCSPSSLGWHMRNGAIFWGVDDQGSLLCDMPLMPTVAQQRLLQAEAIADPNAVIPPSKALAEVKARSPSRPQLNLRRRVAALAAITLARQYWLREAISNDPLPSWKSILPTRDSHIRRVRKQEFIAAISEDKRDSFAKTFVAKANAQNLWGNCVGYWNGKTLVAAIVTQHYARDPKTANLSLLHTFAKHRGNSYASKLVTDSLNEALRADCLYYRVSSEFDSAAFYRKLGFKFIGKKKTAELSMFRLNGPSPKDGSYDLTDAHIAKSALTSRRGGVQKLYKTPQ